MTTDVRPDAAARLLAALDRLPPERQDAEARRWPTDIEMERMIARPARIPSARAGGEG